MSSPTLVVPFKLPLTTIFDEYQTLRDDLEEYLDAYEKLNK